MNKNTEAPFSYSKAGHFISHSREQALKTLSRFVHGYRRGILLVIGNRGVGKTQTVREALEKEDVWRILPHSRQKVRRVIPFWVDLSFMGIPSPLEMRDPDKDNNSSGRSEQLNPTPPLEMQDPDKNNNEGNSRKYTCEPTKMEFSDQDLLIAVMQALATRFAPHADFRRKGKGLRTILGFWEYHLGLKHLFFEMKERLTPHGKKTLNYLQSAWAPLFLFLMLPLFYIFKNIIPWVGTRLSAGAVNTLPPSRFATILTQLASSLSYHHDLPDWVIFPTYICVFFLSVILLRRLDISLLLRRSEELARLSYADNYSLHEVNKQGRQFKAKNNFKLGNIFFSRSAENKTEEKTLFNNKSTPYLLRCFQEYLFFLHRFGIEPVLIIDEIDKLSAEHYTHDSFLTELNKTEVYWPRDFREPLPSNELIMFCDRMLRFKESIFKHLSTIVIADSNFAMLIDRSSRSKGQYHTLVQEILFLQPIGPNAVKKLILTIYNKIGRNTCTGDSRKQGANASEPHDGEKQASKKNCEPLCTNHFCQTTACRGADKCFYITLLSWYCSIMGKGNYAEILTILRSFIQSDWSLNDDTLWDLLWLRNLASYDAGEKDENEENTFQRDYITPYISDFSGYYSTLSNISFLHHLLNETDCIIGSEEPLRAGEDNAKSKLNGLIYALDKKGLITKKSELKDNERFIRISREPMRKHTALKKDEKKSLCKYENLGETGCG